MYGFMFENQRSRRFFDKSIHYATMLPSSSERSLPFNLSCCATTVATCSYYL